MSDLPELSEGYGPADLEDAVVRLKHARDEHGFLEGLWDDLRSVFEAQHAAERERYLASRKLVQDLEAHTREVGLALWESGDKASKTLRPGIGIRETNEVTYDAGRALEWAKVAGYCLTLDARRFEKLAVEDIAGVLPPGLATVKKVPTVTIGKDLP